MRINCKMFLKLKIMIYSDTSRLFMYLWSSTHRFGQMFLWISAHAFSCVHFAQNFCWLAFHVFNCSPAASDTIMCPHDAVKYSRFFLTNWWMLYIKRMSANTGLSITCDGLNNRTLRGTEPSCELFLLWRWGILQFGRATSFRPPFYFRDLNWCTMQTKKKCMMHTGT